jgi:glycerol-1-phosphatase
VALGRPVGIRAPRPWAARPYDPGVLLIVDLDGVVYRGREPIPGMPELLRRRADAGDSIVYCTNNSHWHRSEYLDRLSAIGVPVSVDGVVTSARATALALTEGDARPSRAMVLGGEGLARELEEVGLRALPATEVGLDQGPDVLVVGIDFGLSHERLSVAARAVRSGARFVATNRDPVYPATNGRLLAGAGAIVAAVEAAAGRPPDLVVGKPEPTMFREAAHVAGSDVRDAVVIGDSLVSDIPAAHAVGARSVLMLTGVSTPDELVRLEADARPTAVAHDANELARVLERMATER